MEIEINGKRFTLIREASRNRNAWARLREDILTITIPSRWPEPEKRRIGDELLAKAMKAIEKGRWTGVSAKKVGFSHGQKLELMGRALEIEFVSAGRFRAKMTDGGSRLVVMMDESHPKKHEKASAIAKGCIIGMLMPELKERIGRINDTHFKARVRRITIRDNLSRWGSCSRDGSISLNLRLLFMPQTILDYVIVHELAHTRYRSHGPRFWALVGSVMPDHKERRKWLRDNGWDYPKDDMSLVGKEIIDAKKEGQLKIADFIYEEPY